MLQAIVLSTLAGAMIPLGALLAKVEHIHPRWLELEFRHFVIAFGGGALLAAVALVLVPQGSASLPAWGAVACLIAGGALFMGIDMWLARAGSGKGQLLAMLADFVPEAIALGALFAAGSSSAPLLALIIGLQNLPEGFNAWREADRDARHGHPSLRIFCLLALIGPAAALLGHVVMADLPGALGALMVTASGGILYLIFQDIAPQAPLQRSWAPPLGAVTGFALGLLGHLVIK